ncbi:MAG: biotin--[Parasporobacterium sp.]|nr:biotin--[acetyl-CoA-carboxylase] ligase [Parasporobacterium sp.]
MNTKDRLIGLLEEHDGEFLSGNEIAAEAGITRAGIWKCIKQLEEEGYQIEAVRNRGYRLGPANDAVSKLPVLKYLEAYQQKSGETLPFTGDRLEVQKSVTSTNDVLKERASHLPGWYTVIAGNQTRGKGRRTRSFFSPPETGVYLSVLIKLPLPAETATRITTAAAVAACRAIEETTQAIPQIKWVNDVFVKGKKVCGILTEASISMESGGLEWAIMGIGFNVYEPEGGFPEELAGIAGAISEVRVRDLRSRIAAAFLIHFYQLCLDLTGASVAAEYRKRSFLPGKRINVIKGEQERPATAEEIDDECHLVVRYDDGTREVLSSGEVSIRMDGTKSL